MASPISGRQPLSSEEYSYVRTAVLAVVHAVRSVFRTIGRFFSSFWPKKITPPPVVQPPAPPPQPQPRAAPPLEYLPRPQDLLNIVSRLPFREQDEIHEALAVNERNQMWTITRLFTECSQGAATEHLIARGKAIAAANPYILIELLRARDELPVR